MMKSFWHSLAISTILLFLLIGRDREVLFAQNTMPTVSCQVANEQIAVGGWTELTLKIENVTDFYGYSLTLRYDPTLTEIRDGDANREGVNAKLGGFVQPDFLSLNDVIEPGQLWLDLMQLGQTKAVSGNGVLSTILLQGLKNGSLDFAIVNVTLYDLNGTEIPYKIKNCTLEIAGQPVSTPTTTATSTQTTTETPTASTRQPPYPQILQQ